MVIERFAKKGAGIAGSAVGGGIGGFLSSPFGLGALGLVALLGGLFIFRDRIGEFFGNLKLPELPSLPDITFPSLPDISFPDITFPTFEFPTFEFPDITFPSFDFEFPSFDLPELPDIAGGVGDFFGGLQSDFDNFIKNLIPDQPLTEADQFDFSGLVGGVSPTPTGEPAGQLSDAERFAQDFPEEFIPSGLEAIPPPPPEIISEFEQEFIGGGPSFIGGSVTETPTCNLSLSQIIDKFNVTASQAANIKAEACNDFGDFDFGTNTGSGIFGTPTPTPSTQGLSAREIARLITQGLLPPQFLS